MNPNRFVRTVSLAVLITFSLFWGANQAMALKPTTSGDPTLKSHDPNSIRARQKQRVTNAQRKAAAARAAAKRPAGKKGPTPIGPITSSAIVAPPASAPMPLAGTRPDYLGGVTPNWAWTQPLQKFVDTLPGLTSAGANNLGQYLPVALPDTTTYPGSDYYEIELGQYTEQMHSNLPPTKLQGYRQTNTTDVTVSKFNYLGPVIVAQKDRPVRIKFTNSLPTGMGGDLFIPVDPTGMGAGMGPYRADPTSAVQVGLPADPCLVEITTAAPHNLHVGERIMPMGFAPAAYNGMFTVLAVPTPTTFRIKLAANPGGPATITAGMSMITENFSQNRATLHLHGGRSPWISDGTPHQWTTPANEITRYPKGVSVKNVPDMPDPGPGSLTFFYSNQQSARLMFYHDHAWGITRLNVYTGEAAGYLITDQVEQDLITAGLLPNTGVPLIIQDKTFVDASTLPITDPTWNWGSQPGMAVTGDLWYSHVYMPNQNANDLGGLNAMGRWDYGPWFWPPWPVNNPPITMPDGSVQPNLPDVSMTMEGFHDTPLINGTAYPKLTVDPKTYRFRILNAANDRFLNLQLYQAASSIVGGITITNPGSGYAAVPAVAITPAAGDTTGHGATALATIDPATGQVVAVDLVSVGSGYTAAPTVTIAGPTGTAPLVTATATATLYNAAPTEVGMVPALPGAASFPVAWTTQTLGQPGDILDGRAGGVPDPALMGPPIIQIGTEGGFLPAPVVWPNIPIGFERNPKDIVVGNVKEHNLFLGPAERADILIDFSAFAGKTLILYNDAPAAVPAADSRLDYYTCDVNQTDTGGHTSTLPGYGPNTRTIMQIVVSNTTPAPAYNLGALQTAFASTATTPGVFAKGQDPILVPQGSSWPQGASTVINGYNTAYNATFPTGTTAYERIQSTSLTFNPLDLTQATKLSPSALTIVDTPKAIAEEFENDWGRMSAFFGVELPFTNGGNQTTIFYGYIDPPATFVNDNVTTASPAAGDGTQIWKITHNGVDTHPLHFHLFDVQLINRVGWDGAVRPPEENELGWKETVRMNPLEDCIVALRPVAPKQPFGLPDSQRPLNPSMPLHDATGFKNVDPLTGNPITVTNEITNFGWEYVFHCHILSHEEMDMMRPLVFNVARSLPAAPALTVLGGTQASLSWTDATPPTPVYPLAGNTWGNAAGEIGFRIERAENGGAFASLATVPANTTAYNDATINALSSYSYRVIAFNVAGESVSNVAVLATVPGAPLSVTAVAGDAQATVSFAPPASNGGSAITLYTVTSNPSGITATGAVSPITVTGLTNGTTYTFTVTATNGVGTGPASSPSNAVTPQAGITIAAPSSFTATLQNGPQVALSWIDNANNETGFVVERSLNGGTFTMLVTLGARTGTGTTVNYTDKTVMVGNTYTYQVKAINLTGSSAYATAPGVYVPLIPAAPSNLTLTSWVGGVGAYVRLNWTDNANAPNNETRFAIQRATDAGFTTNVGNYTAAANATAFQQNVSRGVNYYYRIRAVNLSGSSAWVNATPFPILTP